MRAAVTEFALLRGCSRNDSQLLRASGPSNTKSFPAAAWESNQVEGNSDRR